MSENSAFWEGHLIGDAASLTGWAAKYTSNSMSDILAKLLSGDNSSGYVVPDYENELLTAGSLPGGMSVTVSAGKAIVNGRIYANTSNEVLDISPNLAGQPRLDRVVLQTTFATQVCRLYILEGTPGIPPTLPALTQNANIYEVSLAYVWVAPSSSSILDADIHDERLFLQTFATTNNYAGANNEIFNSEYILTDYKSAAGPLYYYYPAGWTGDLITEAAHSVAPSQMIRGRAITLTAKNTSTTGLSQDFAIKPNTTYAIKILVKVATGSVGYIMVDTDSLAPETINRTIRRTNAWIEEICYYTSEFDASRMTVSFYLPSTAGQILYAGQVLVVEGYHTGEFRPFHETILVSNAEAYGCDLCSYTGTAVETLDLSSWIIDAKAAFFNFLAGTPLDTARVDIKPYGKTDVWIGCVGGRGFHSGEIILTNGLIDIDHVITGTMDVSWYVDGVQT